MITEQRTLTMHADARIHEVELKPTDPICRYLVSDERGIEVAFISNTRPTGHVPNWEVARIKDRMPGEPIGDYATAEEALSALQKEFER